LAVIAGTVAAAAGAAYAIGSAGTTSQAQTMAFATLALAELLAVFSMRSTTVLAWHGPPNRGLAAAVMGSLALLVATVYLPVANHILGTVTLSPWDTACVAGLALLPLLVSELWKLASARRSRR
ncbi:MAG: cation transporting ATPase C-terminal domain-containing protein, partial [Gaiellales bacterium]